MMTRALLNLQAGTRMSDDDIKRIYLEQTGFDLEASESALLDFARAIERASRRAAIKEAHSACLAGVKWSPEPSKEIQFYVSGTCHRLAAEISQLAAGDGKCMAAPVAPAVDAQPVAIRLATDQLDWVPNRIWLQRGVGEGGSHTWCEDSIDDCEQAEYVRVDPQ
jgi:hypothetical protein